MSTGRRGGQHRRGTSPAWRSRETGRQGRRRHVRQSPARLAGGARPAPRRRHRGLRDEPTSYTIVVTPPGEDRSFLHCSGANQTFCAEDVPYERAGRRPAVSFRLPAADAADVRRPRRTAARDVRAGDRGGGLDVARSLRARSRQRRRTRGLGRAAADRHCRSWTCSPPASTSCCSCSTRSPTSGCRPAIALASVVDHSRLAQLGSRLTAMGAAVVAIKLGDQGLYCVPPGTPRGCGALCDRLGLRADAWLDRELLSPCFQARQRQRHDRLRGRDRRRVARGAAAWREPERGGRERDCGRRLQRRGGRPDQRDPDLGAGRPAHRGRLAAAPD